MGLLTGLPVLLLAAAAIPGSLLVAKVGARRALRHRTRHHRSFGCVARARIIRHGALRHDVCDGLRDRGFTALTPIPGKGLVNRFSRLATAAFSNGMLIGEILPVALTASVIVPIFAGSWNASLAFWSVPVVLTAVAILLFTRNLSPERLMRRRLVGCQTGTTGESGCWDSSWAVHRPRTGVRMRSFPTFCVFTIMPRTSRLLLPH